MWDRCFGTIRALKNPTNTLASSPEKQPRVDHMAQPSALRSETAATFMHFLVSEVGATSVETIHATRADELHANAGFDSIASGGLAKRNPPWSV